MFNMDDKTYLNRPVYISTETIQAVARFLKKGCQELKIEHLVLEIHGGEPLMQGKSEFDYMCSYFETELKDTVEIEFVMQTNGMLLDDEWLKLVRKYHIGFGMSLDGPKEYHDKYRIDKLGKGTYDRVVSKLKYVQSSELMYGFPHKVGVLSVINPTFDAKKIYRHFVDDLKLIYFDFLTPFSTHHHTLDYPIEAYGKFLCDLFDEWIGDNNPKIEIRFLRSVMNNFFGKNSLIYGVGPANSKDLPLISIASNGDLSPTDELRSIGDGSVVFTGATVSNTNLGLFLKADIFGKLQIAQESLPDDCQICCWKKVCAGGSIVNRFKNGNFNNSSIYCSGLKMLYRRIATYISENGYGPTDIARMLGINAPERSAVALGA